MEHLNALASICESAERMPTTSRPYTTGAPLTVTTFSSHHLVPTSSDYLHRSYYTSSLPLLCNTPPPQYISSLATGSYLTPPITPASALTAHTQQEQDHSEVLAMSLQCPRPTNPVMRNIISYASYLRYLDRTWPEKCSRRGSAVIRTSLYTQIADCLKGGASTARFRYWVRKSGFFLLEKQQPCGNYDTCIAVPLHPKSQGNKRSAHGKQYRLVAKLEEFLPLIGEYHNDSIGHYGIRKTYQMIQQDYTYLPRSAIAKFVQLCDVCSVRGKRVSRREDSSTDKVSHAAKEEDTVTRSGLSQSVTLLPAEPSPEGGEIEITTESVSPSSSLQIEDLAASPLLATSLVEESQESAPTVCMSESLCALEGNAGKETSEHIATDSVRVTDNSYDLYQQIHESVRHLLEGLTWEETLQLYAETTDNALTTSPNILLRM